MSIRKASNWLTRARKKSDSTFSPLGSPHKSKCPNQEGEQAQSMIRYLMKSIIPRFPLPTKVQHIYIYTQPIGSWQLTLSLVQCGGDNQFTRFAFAPFLDGNVTRQSDGPKEKSGSDFPFSEMLERTGKLVEQADFGVLCGSSLVNTAIFRLFKNQEPNHPG